MGVIDKAVSWAVAIANDDSHKYSQSARWGPHYDCSSFIITAYKQAGINTGATYTGDMYKAFTAKGFKNVTSSVNLSTGAGLKKGDILLNTKYHTALVRENGGAVVHASGVKNGICCSGYYVYSKGGWDYVLRYPESGSGGSSAANLSVKKTISLPPGFGKYYTYETWNREAHGYSPWNADSMQERLITVAKLSGDYGFDSEGYGKIGNRYVVAMTDFFGAVGDYVDIYCEDGRVIMAVIGDLKNQNDPGCNKWGHEHGQVVVEFMTNWPANPPHSNPKSNGGVKKVLNYGSYFNTPDFADLSEGSYSTESSRTEKLEIVQEKTMAAYGEQMAERKNLFAGRKNAEKDAPDVELYIISHDGVIYKPIIEDGIEWETTYSGTAAQLTFTVIKDENIAFDEGSQVVFKYQGASLFHGFVFKKNRDKDHRIKCTCYDQMRYLQNKNSMVYSDKTATEVIKMIAKDFSLSIGDLVDTAEKIPLRVEDNASLFDIIQYALDYTTWKTGVWYTFYDDFGKLTLKRSTDMKSNCVITQDNAENFDYTSSINESTYTRIRRYYDNTETGVREVYTYDESGKRPQYGVLQLCEKIDDENIEAFRTGAENQMKRELSQYAAPTRNIEIKGVMGDVMVRGGSIVYVTMDLGDIIINSEKSGHYFICDSVKHTFSNDNHTMDVYLTGGGYRFI